MTYNTGNPIGSTDARDRLDNSEFLDEVVNSFDLTKVDRLGRTRDTLEGIYQKSAYYRVGTFEAGYTLTNNRQTLAYGNVEYSWSGVFPKVVTSGSSPETTGGIGAGAWVDRTDLTLRSEISDIDGAGLIGSMSYAQLRTYSGSQTTVNIWGITSVTDGAAGVFKVNSSDTTSADNGGTILVDASGRRWFRVFAGNVFAEWFGAKGDGVTNDAISVQSALNSLGTKGGTVNCVNKYLINSNITIPSNCTLKGPMSLVGSPSSNNSAPYGNVAALILSASATITLGGGSGIDGALIYRAGMTFPAADSSSFSGTAITAAGDDCFVRGSMVLGFNLAYVSNGYQRPRLQDFYFDCANGIDISSCYDLSHIRDCHGWPFATIAQYALDTTKKTVIQRGGVAYNLHDVGDWNKLTDCFSYGYYRGFIVSNANSLTLNGCSVDSTGNYPGQLGFVVTGSSMDTRLVNCQAAAQDSGYYINTTGSNIQTRLIGCDSWACTNNGVYIGSGDVSVLGGTQRNTACGVTINSSTSTVVIDGVRFAGITTYPINPLVSNASIKIGANNDYYDWPSSQPVVNNLTKLIPSAITSDPISIPVNAKEFRLLATSADSGAMQGGWAGRVVTLIFSDPVLIYHGGSSPTGFKLSGSANFSAVANSTLTVIHDGSYWREIGRCV